MVDFRPLQGLRYQPTVAGDLGTVIAPPYDVISAEAQQALYDRSPYNVVRIEFAREETGSVEGRYQRTASTLQNWRRQDVVRCDANPSFYLYEQRFTYRSQEYRRRSIVGRVRLEPWENGTILPHEHTLAGPKEDRLQLLRACRTNISPVFGLYRPDGGAAIAICERATASDPVSDAIDSTGQRHRLWLVDDPAATAALQMHFNERTLYIADGHHRYETALAYRDERRSESTVWTGDEPENFVLMALTAADDPGLLILPIHRLVRPNRVPDDLGAELRARFDLQAVEPSAGRPAALGALEDLMQDRAESGAALGALTPAQTLLLSVRDRAAIEAQMPLEASSAWRALGVNVLQYGVLQPLFGIDIETVRAGEQVTFTESAEEALESVESGAATYAFLLNATRPEEIFAVADTGDRMPQKSTYFYPKLGTGLVLYQMDVPDAVPGAV